jgi:hypothetical protein
MRYLKAIGEWVVEMLVCLLIIALWPLTCWFRTDDE